jgi:hypothetical protein
MRKFVDLLIKFRKVIFYSALTAVFCSLFLFSPKPTEEYCGKYIDVGRYASFPLNCDSYNYVETAARPAKLFEKESIRQTRPVYVIVASALGYVISPVFSVLPLDRAAAKDELLASPFYWGFIVLNFVFLLGSLLLFDRVVDILTNGKFPQTPKYLLAVFLVSNVVIKTSIFSAHQQMLTLFSPLLCIYLCLKIALAESLDARKIGLISLLGGIALLAYGNFLILIPSVWLAMMLQIYRTNSFSSKQTLSLFLPSSFLFLLPSVGWSGVLYFYIGSVYSHEVTAYRQFVWVFDKLGVSFQDFYAQLLAFTTLYGTTIYRTVLVFLAVFVLLKLFNFLPRLENEETDRPTDHFLMSGIVLVIFTLYLMFFWLMGYYSERLTFTLVPVALCLIALELNLLLARGRRLTVKTIYVLLLFCALFWTYSSVTTYGPFRDLTRTKPASSPRLII